MEDVRTPTSWRRPRSKIYDYNRQFGGKYYQPMVDYMDSKERMGPFFERPSERIHFPDPVELVCKKIDGDVEMTGGPGVERFLTQAYAQQIKEQNSATAKTQAALMRRSMDMTTLTPRLTSGMLRDHYVKEVRVMEVAGGNTHMN